MLRNVWQFITQIGPNVDFPKILQMKISDKVYISNPCNSDIQKNFQLEEYL